MNEKPFYYFGDGENINSGVIDNCTELTLEETVEVMNELVYERDFYKSMIESIPFIKKRGDDDNDVNTGNVFNHFSVQEWDIWDYADTMLVIFKDDEFISNVDVVNLLNKLYKRNFLLGFLVAEDVCHMKGSEGIERDNIYKNYCGYSYAEANHIMDELEKDLNELINLRE